MKNVSLYIDVAFCLIVLPLMAMLFPVERWLHNFQWYVLTVGAWLYILYFLNRFMTVPFLFDHGRRKLIGAVVLVSSLAVTYILSQVTLYIPKPNILDAGITRILPSVQPYQQAVFSLFMIVEVFSFAVGSLMQANLQKSRRMAVEAEREKAEIALYKAQIKPHFMFNTLNSIYGLFLTRDNKALESLEKFISMTRYLQIASVCDYVPVADEADYIKQYVGLQALRLNEMTSVSFESDIENPSLRVPPMLLVTFVENCFKHGVSPVEESVIRISLIESDSRLTLTTENRIFPVKHPGEHMGIENCRRRLGLLYPRRHSLEIHDDGAFYNVKLSIDLSI